MAVNLFMAPPASGMQLNQLIFTPSPVQDAFIRSNAVIVVLVGPQGEGKTWAASVALVYHAMKWRNILGKTLRAAIIRDTHENIKRMTVPSLQEALGQLIQFRNDYKQANLIDGSLSVDLFGMDDEASLTKLQGAEYGLVWLEEPAPILDRANAGLSINIFNTAITRAARQIKAEDQEKGIMPRIQVTMNPADESHWTFSEFIENPRFPSEDFPDITIEVFNIPYGENKYLSDISRQATKAGYAKEQGLYDRYVAGRWSFVMSGKAVTPEYDASIHRSSHKLNPIPNLPVIRGWDGGLNPTCVFVQVFPTGRIAVTDTLVGENMGMRQFIQMMVKPTINHRYAKVTQWTDIGDPTLMSREQSDSDQYAARIIEEELKTRFIKGTKDWGPRREAIKQALRGTRFLLSRHEGRLHRALRGGWHYATDNNGNVITDKPKKDIHSHPADALSYVLAYILGAGGEIEKPKRLTICNIKRPSWRTV